MNEPSIGLQPLDWLLIAIYAASTIGLGFYFSRRQRSTDEYFVGSRNMNPLFIGVSLFATLLSTISYLSMPGEAAGMGPVFLVSLGALPLVYAVVAYGLLPVYMEQQVTSAYELLEAKLGISIRLLGAAMFLTLRLVWMTLLIYLAAKATTVMMGIHPKWVPLIVLMIGAVSVVYTTMGGLRAVVITDFMQTLLLFGGALLVIATVTYDYGGFGWFPTRWQPTWDVQPIFSSDPKTRITMVGIVASVFFWYVATLGGDQTSVQRFMATRDVKAARQALATQLTVNVVVQITLFLVGFSLLGYFLAHPDQLPRGMDLKHDADQLFPRYISYHLRPGISGLVVAAMFAAAMSSIDSGVNSITAVVLTDFLDRTRWKPKSEAEHLRLAKCLALGVGVIVVFGSSMMKFVSGNITEVTNKTANLLATPIFGLFFYALFVRFSNPVGVWIGTLCGIVAAAMIAFSGPLVYLLHTTFDVELARLGVEEITSIDLATGQEWATAENPISFQWIGPVSFVVNIVTGTVASRLYSRLRLPRHRQSRRSSDSARTNHE